MKYRLAKPFLFLVAFILIVGLACSAASPNEPASPDAPVAEEPEVPAPTPVVEVASPIPPPPTNVPVSTPTTVPPTSPPVETQLYQSWEDGTGALYIDAPSSWTESSGDIWESTWGDISFQAANIILSADLEGFSNYYDVPGVDFAASKDWGKIGGYVQLLDAAKDSWYSDCDYEGRYDYEDSKFEGRIDGWQCSPGTESWVLAARPIVNSSSYLILVQIQVDPDDADYEDAWHILETFNVDPARLP